MTRKIHLLNFLISFSAIFLALFLSHKYELMENGVYLKYFKSMLHDLDFNIFNQFEDKMDQWLATENDNHPDYHSPFISSLLFFGHIFIQLVPYSEQLTDYYLLIMTRVIFFSCSFVYLLKRGAVTEVKILIWLSLLSSTCWNLFVEVSDVSFLCLPFTLVIFHHLTREDNNRSDLITIGILTAILASLKPDATPWIMGVGFYYILKKDLKSFAIYSLLVGMGLVPFIVSNYIKFSLPLIAHPAASIMNISMWENFFGPNGVLFKSPLLMIGILGLALAYKEKKEVVIAALSILFLKYLLTSITILTISDDFGSRHQISELPIYSWGWWQIYKRKRSLLKYLSIPAAGWLIYSQLSWLLGFFSENDFRLNYFFGPEVIYQHRHAYLHYLNERLDQLNTHHLSWLMVATIGGVIFTLIRLLPLRVLQAILVAPLIINLVSGSLDLIHNEANSRQMREEGLFDQTVIVRGDGIYYDEILDLVYLVERQSEHNYSAKIDIDRFKQSYLEQFKQQVLNDPIGIKRDIDSGIIRKSFWQQKFDDFSNENEANSL